MYDYNDYVKTHEFIRKSKLNYTGGKIILKEFYSFTVFCQGQGHINARKNDYIQGYHWSISQSLTSNRLLPKKLWHQFQIHTKNEKGS